MFGLLLGIVLGISGICAVLEYDDPELFENDDAHFHQ
jgi:hypothetical protein